MMILCHGSSIQVKELRILERLRALGFGAGFYTTSSLEQAEKWARVVTKRRRTGLPTVSSYSLDNLDHADVNILKFDSP